jgi:hypothetical protein
LIIGDHSELTSDHALNHRPNLTGLRFVVDLDAHLPEAHERPHADAADDQGIDLVSRQQLHWDHATTLDMRDIGYRTDLFDLSVFDIDESKDIAVTEMTGANPVKPALAF